MIPDEPRAITLGELLDDLDGRGLVITDPAAIEYRLKSYYDLESESDLTYTPVP